MANCTYCGEEMKSNATFCRHCNKHQARWKNWLEASWVPLLLGVIGSGIVWLYNELRCGPEAPVPGLTVHVSDSGSTFFNAGNTPLQLRVLKFSVPHFRFVQPEVPNQFLLPQHGISISSPARFTDPVQPASDAELEHILRTGSFSGFRFAFFSPDDPELAGWKKDFGNLRTYEASCDVVYHAWAIGETYTTTTRCLAVVLHRPTPFPPRTYVEDEPRVDDGIRAREQDQDGFGVRDAPGSSQP